MGALETRTFCRTIADLATTFEMCGLGSARAVRVAGHVRQLSVGVLSGEGGQSPAAERHGTEALGYWGTGVLKPEVQTSFA